MGVEIISDNLTIVVPSDYPDIQSALDYLEGKSITGSVNIQVLDGEYQVSESIKSRVCDYQNLSIRGNEDDCSKCILYINNVNNNDGFLFDNGFGISWLNGFTIAGVNGWLSDGVWNDECYGSGIRAIGGGSVVLGSSIYITKMYYGIRSMYGALISNETNPRPDFGGGIKVSNAGDVAFHAYSASLKVNCAEARYTSHSKESLGFGFCAEAGGFLQCEYSISNDNYRAGFYSLTNGTVWAHGTIANGNDYGILSWGGGIECNSIGDYISSFSQNTSAGIYCTNNGFIGANKALCHNNGHGVFSDNGGIVDVTSLRSEDNNQNGFFCTKNGVISGFNSSARSNGNNGYHCEYSSTMLVEGASSYLNGNNGFYAKKNSNIYCKSFGGDGNKYFCSPIQKSTSDLVDSDGSSIDDTV